MWKALLHVKGKSASSENAKEQLGEMGLTLGWLPDLFGCKNT